MASRALTMAVWIFSINTAFTLLNYVNPFHATITILTDPFLFNSTFAASAFNSTSGLGVFGLLFEFVPIINFFLSMLLGPLTLVPALLGLVGFTGIWQYALAGLIWIPYTIFIVQLITGRVFQVTK